MATRFRPTLGQVFFVTIVGLAVLLGGLFALFLEGSRESIVRSSGPLRDAKSAEIGLRVESYLHKAEQAIEHIENQIRYGSCHAENALSVEAHLFAELLNDRDLAEVAFTHALRKEYEEDTGRIVIAPEARWQVSAFRETAEAKSPILTRFTYPDRGGLVSDLRKRAPESGLLEAPLLRQTETPPDPTEHLTFVTPAAERFLGRKVWSDLSYTELDDRLPEPQRRVVVTVMKAVEDRAERFVGVVRVALLERELDKLTALTKGDVHRTFLCDDHGRLLTRIAPGDRLADLDGDLRIVSKDLPVEVGMALEHQALKDVRPEKLLTQAAFDAHGRKLLLSFRGLPATQGWRVGMVVAEDDLPGIKSLVEAQRKLMLWSLALSGLILVGGVLTLRAVRRGLKQVVDQTARMRNFDFAPAAPSAPFRDVEDVMDSVELAKTAMRAMGKYVPVDLVRHLYQTKREPVLGGELADVTLMFTDIKDFTSYAESLAPNAVAEALGLYLEAMTDAVHKTGGTIDKYIGDAVMAVWNAPSPASDHPLRACRAALDCASATERLYASPAWGERPRFVTRFGLHSDRVMVGHFGAPERMSYTALGDGVNLASRLEGLNKQYGTTILASQAVYEAAKQAFAFRLLDRVAVKGKTKGIRVFELLGDAAGAGPRAGARRYEEALLRYFARRFAEALAILETQPDDPPSVVLAGRCRAMQQDPPPPDWDGIYISRTK